MRSLFPHDVTTAEQAAIDRHMEERIGSVSPVPAGVCPAFAGCAGGESPLQDSKQQAARDLMQSRATGIDESPEARRRMAMSAAC